MSKTKGFLFTASIGLAITFTLSCSGDDGGGDGGGGNPSSSSVGGSGNIAYGSFTDTRDGKEYKTVVIGTQTWLAENLNYAEEDSKCYGNSESNCVVYGRLYTWSQAMAVCPSGWHLPSQAEWNAMTAYIGGAGTEGKKLRATSGWNSDCDNGTDEFGFSALPGGEYEDGSFSDVGSRGRWWSTGVNGEDLAFNRRIYCNGDGAGWSDRDKRNSYSVRCLKNDGDGDGGSSSSVGSNPSSSSVGGFGGSSSSRGGSSSSGRCPVAEVSDGSVTCGEQTYRTVVMGTQTWFAENLNYEVEGSRCYDDDPENCEIYGRLYSWRMARSVCPSGWHLPSQAEWNTMTAYIGGENLSAKKLKTTSGWNNYGSASGNGTDEYGFSALPGGNYSLYEDEGFRRIGEIGFWWSSSMYNSYNAHYRLIPYNYDYGSWNFYNEDILFSVRCLKDKD